MQEQCIRDLIPKLNRVVHFLNLFKFDIFGFIQECTALKLSLRPLSIRTAFWLTTYVQESEFMDFG